MNTLLALTALLALGYPCLALINQHLHMATPLYPPWQWAAALAWPALANRRFLKRPRSLLWLLAFNLVLFFPAGLTFLATPYPSGRWPAVLPALIELALLWVPTAHLATRPLEEENLRRLWESGLVIAALAALIREISHTPIPFFKAALLVYIAAGVALRALAAAAETSTPDATEPRTGTPLTVSLGVLLFGAALGFVVEGRRFAGLLLAGLRAGWQFLRLLAYYLALLIDKLGLNRVPGQPSGRPQIPGAPPPPDLGPGLQSAPLWVMIPLWTLLAVMLVFLAWMLFKMLCETIAAWRREMAASIVPARRRLRRPDLRLLLAAAAALLRLLTNRMRRWRNRRHPRNLPALYDAFAAWGRRNRRPRRRSETPGAYLQRLEPEVTAACPELLPVLRQLTRRYERFCYGQNGGPGLSGEETTLARRLRKSRLQQKKFFERLQGAVRRGWKKTADAFAGNTANA